MTIHPAEADVRAVYRALIEIVTPRPIAWVSTVDAEGRVNVAPFSFFNVFGSNPPVVVFSPTLRRDGSKKDTLLNVEMTGEFVVNASVESAAASVVQTSAELEHGRSEAEFAKLTLVPSERVKPPRVAESPVHLECRLLQILPVGGKPLSANLVIGEVVLIHVDESVLDQDGHIDPRKLRTIGRMGGDDYCRTSDLFRMPRPTS
jgi:flavin reductase (DIM6/NTAB) family NADH-FMN oxidoreductase RutF